MWINLEHCWRCPTRAAIDALALRFNLRNTRDMQDWEYEVADAKRINEFLAAYESGELNDDERFTLMETLLESCCEAEMYDKAFLSSDVWKKILALLEQNIALHIYTVWYWSDTEQAEEDTSDSVVITPCIRTILLRQQQRFALPVNNFEGIDA